MKNSSNYSPSGLSIPPMSTIVKGLIISNVVIWLFFQVILEGYLQVPFLKIFGFFPGKVLFEGSIWQIFSYMFLHSLSVNHILFNMLMLWFVGVELEKKWGQKFFLTYYILSGAGAALIYLIGTGLYSFITGSQSGLFTPVVGASGAIFGLFLAYGLIFGDRKVLFMFIFPMTARTMILVLGLIEAVSLLTSGVNGGDVANLAHLGGIVSGYLILRFWSRWEKIQWNRKVNKKASSLKLVVDNEKPFTKGNNTKDNPKYWN